MTRTVDPAIVEPDSRSTGLPAVPRPRTALLVAIVVAAASVLASLAGAGWGIGLGLMVLAVAVTVWATIAAVRRDSVFVAPLAIVLVAVLNPLVLSGLAAHIQERAGVITFAFDRGLVLWSTYPGIAGWDAPEDAAPVNTTALAQAEQRALRGAVEATTAAHGWVWSIGEGAAGVFRIANGYGGDSLFERVDSPVWTSEDFDGSAPQRDLLLSSAQTAAAALELTTVTEAEGDVTTGDGMRRWDDGAGGVMTLRVAGSRVTLQYTGGPFLSGSSSAAEYRLARSGFEGLQPPAPIEEPDLP